MTTDQPPLKRDGRTVHRIEDIARLAGIGVEAAYKLVNRAGLTPVERIGNVYADADVKRALKRPRAGMGGPKKETPMFSYTDLASELNLGAEKSQRIAQFAGAFQDLAEVRKTGVIPRPWIGQGVDFLLTREQMDELAAEWRRAATDTGRVAYLSQDPEDQEIANRYS